MLNSDRDTHATIKVSKCGKNRSLTQAKRGEADATGWRSSIPGMFACFNLLGFELQGFKAIVAVLFSCPMAACLQSSFVSGSYQACYNRGLRRPADDSASDSQEVHVPILVFRCCFILKALQIRVLHTSQDWALMNTRGR